MDRYEEVDISNYPVHRTTSIHRNTSRGRSIPKNISQERIYDATYDELDDIPDGPLEKHAANIVKYMENDRTLMEDNPEAEQLRKQTIRDMPQCLTVKRTIKKQLTKTISLNSKRKPLSCFKTMKYRLSMSATKAKLSFKNILYSFELWYGTLKKIEGRFGSGVATYFKFLRWLFLMNCLVLFPIIGFVVVPQLWFNSVYEKHVEVGDISNETESENLMFLNDKNAVRLNTTESYNNATFRISNIFTGEGYFTNSIMYYGFYTNVTTVAFSRFQFSIPYSYFLTMVSIYLITFVILAVSVAISYRKSFIETSHGLHNVFAVKIFCGWDFSIAKQKSAELKSTAIYNEIRELLSDYNSPTKEATCMNKFWTRSIQITFNLLFLIALSGIAYLMWVLLEEIHDKTFDELLNDQDNISVVLTAVVVNLIMVFFPLLISFVVKYEDYKNYRVALYITLARTYLLEIVIVGVVVVFWLTRTNEQCWETSLGQEIYRLILFDFIFSVVLAVFVELVRYFIFKRFWKNINAPEFDIARHTLQIIYNQTLFWLGLYFSPLLAAVVVIKLLFTWYLRSFDAIYLCKPSAKTWRAAQTHTFFLLLTFLALIIVFLILGYVVMETQPSICGPYQTYNHTYAMITKDVLELSNESGFLSVILVFTKPGVVAGILIVMSAYAYYLRAKALAQKELVKIFRGMLVTEASDKVFLLRQIEKESRKRHRLELQQSREERSEPYSSEPDFTRHAYINQGYSSARYSESSPVQHRQYSELNQPSTSNVQYTDSPRMSNLKEDNYAQRYQDNIDMSSLSDISDRFNIHT